jgi:hypothetical protein
VSKPRLWYQDADVAAEVVFAHAEILENLLARTELAVLAAAQTRDTNNNIDQRIVQARSATQTNHWAHMWQPMDRPRHSVMEIASYPYLNKSAIEERTHE